MKYFLETHHILKCVPTLLIKMCVNFPGAKFSTVQPKEQLETQ